MTKNVRFKEVDAMSVKELKALMNDMIQVGVNHEGTTAFFIYLKAEELGKLTEIQQYAQEIGLQMLSPPQQAG